MLPGRHTYTRDKIDIFQITVCHLFVLFWIYRWLCVLNVRFLSIKNFKFAVSNQPFWIFYKIRNERRSPKNMELKMNALVRQMMLVGVLFAVTAQCGVIDSFDENNESKCWFINCCIKLENWIFCWIFWTVCDKFQLIVLRQTWRCAFWIFLSLKWRKNYWKSLKSAIFARKHRTNSVLFQFFMCFYSNFDVFFIKFT